MPDRIEDPTGGVWMTPSRTMKMFWPRLLAQVAISVERDALAIAFGMASILISCELA